MKIWTNIAGMVAGLAITVSAATANATFAYAPLTELAVFNFGGDGSSADNALVAGGLPASTLVFNNSDPVSFGTREFEAVLGKIATLPNSVKLETGAGNNGHWFDIDYQRFVGMAAPNAPVGIEMGTLRVSITSTLIASVSVTGVLETFTIAGELEITDLNGFYNSPTSGTYRLEGNGATIIPTFGYSLQIEVSGADPIHTTEPALLAVIGGGLLAIGIARARRRHG